MHLDINDKKALDNIGIHKSLHKGRIYFHNSSKVHHNKYFVNVNYFYIDANTSQNKF